MLCGLYTCDMDGSGSFLTTEMFLFAFGNPACMALAQFLTYTNLKTENIREAFDNAAVLSLTDLFWSFILNCGDPIPFRGKALLIKVSSEIVFFSEVVMQV